MKNEQYHRFYGVPWWDDIEEYMKYLDLFDEEEDPKEAYAEWLAFATLDFIQNKAMPNSTVRKVVIRVEELVEYCRQKQISVEDESAILGLTNKKFARWADAESKRKTKKKPRTIAGYAWFDSREEYEKCARAAAESGDSRDWEPYEQWKATAERDFRRHQAAGRQTTIKVVINADEFLRFCRIKGRPISSPTRHAFIKEKLAQRYNDKIF